jgi:hypothetical protein
MDSFSSFATAHLILRLRPLNRALRSAVENQKNLAALLARPDLSPLCLTDAHVQILLDQLEVTQSGSALPGVPALLSIEEQNTEKDLLLQSCSFSSDPPLQRLERDLRLSPFELDTILLCAAPELDRTYERIFGFILDDLNRRFPCVELLSTLTASSLEEVVEHRHLLSCFGRLRRQGFLQPFGDPPTELRQELRLAPGMFDFLTGADTGLPRMCSDRAEVFVPPDAVPPPQVNQNEFFHLCNSVEQGSLAAIGIWGPRQNGVEELVLALGAALRRPLRRLSLFDLERNGSDAYAVLREQLRIASGLGALVWLESDLLRDPSRDRLQHFLSNALEYSPVPIILSGEHPWRPLPLLRAGGYTEFQLGESDQPSREKIWSQTFPELEEQEINDLASRFSLSGADIRSISDLARTRARLAGNGEPEPVNGHLAAACAVVTRRSTSHFATVLEARRGPADLILPEQLHRQVLEVATFFQLRNRVDEDWGFGRLLNGSGMKALFTGEPGTGKTLAAEVIAGILSLPLSKVDLAQIVSKWVGETEKNLEAAFREAEESHAILFFDEAEALFGKRAEVQHGTDRYANLEVSYLLQRLESSRGLVILASNVKDQIDPAFARRFQIAVHFPRPGFAERFRLWTLAFPASAPLDPEIDFDALSRLDMTGAAIVGAARTAALLAADSKAPFITMSHVIRSAARQFRREARVLTPVELGRYGVHLQGAS